MGKIEIRDAAVGDAGRFLEIYAPYVEKTAITFEYDVPSVEEFSGRIEGTLREYPYIAAEYDGRVVGYAYGGRFHPRAAYSHCAEMSIYIEAGMHGLGIGKALYCELERRLAQQGITNFYACIAYPVEEDEYLTLGSVHFHEKMGYSICGRFHKCGVKFGKVYDMVWMEKLAGGEDMG